MQRAAYAMSHIGSLAGVRTPVFSGPHFNEFLVDFNDTGKTVAAINRGPVGRTASSAARTYRASIPQFGQVALYCVTENRSQAEIDLLVAPLER